MLIAILAPVVIFFVVRFLASLYVTRPLIYNIAGAGAALFFLLGLGASPVFFGSPAPPPVAAVPAPPVAVPVPPAAAPPAAAPPANAPAPAAPPAAVAAKAPPVKVFHVRTTGLTAAGGPPALAAIDNLTTDPKLGVNPPGNVFHAGSTIYVRGWAASAEKTPLRGLVFVIDHRLRYDGTAGYGGVRPDVAAAFQAPAMAATGYTGIALPTHGLAAGPHLLQVGGVSDDPAHYHLATVSATFTVQ